MSNQAVWIRTAVLGVLAPISLVFGSVDVSKVTVREGDSGQRNAVFDVTLLEARGVPVELEFETFDVSARSGRDYEGVQGMVVIPAGETSAQVEVVVVGDREEEGTEYFGLKVTSNVDKFVPSDIWKSSVIIDSELNIGTDISLHGATLAVGNPNSSDEFPGGGVDIFHADPKSASWAFANSVVPPELAQRSRYGGPVELSGRWMLVGASGQNSKSAYLFEKQGESWDLLKSFVPGNDQLDAWSYGYQIGIAGEVAALVSAKDTVEIAEAFGGGDGGWGTVARLSAAEQLVDGERLDGGLLVTEDAIAAAPRLGGKVFLFERGETGQWRNSTTIDAEEGERIEGLYAANEEGTFFVGYVSGNIHILKKAPSGEWGFSQIIEKFPGSSLFEDQISAQGGLLAIPHWAGQAQIRLFGRSVDATYKHLQTAPLVGLQPWARPATSFSNGRMGVLAGTNVLLFEPEFAVCAIEDDDDAPELITYKASATEGERLDLILTLDSRPSQDSSVRFTAESRSAVLGEDFPENSGVIEFAAGETEAQISIDLIDDAISEDDEYFVLKLSGAQGVELAQSAIVVELRDDEELPEVSLAANAYCSEADGQQRGCRFLVTLSEPAGNDLSISYALLEGSAKLGSDLIDECPALVIPAGETEGFITVGIVEDDFFEPEESFTIQLTQISKGTLGRSTATGTIRDDDTIPFVTAAVTPPEREGDDGVATAVIRFRLSGKTEEAVSFRYATPGGFGTATPGEDFQPASGEVVFPPGETSAQIEVDVLGDHIEEGDEKITVRTMDFSNALPSFEWGRTGGFTPNTEPMYPIHRKSGDTLLYVAGGVQNARLVHLYERSGDEWAFSQELVVGGLTLSINLTPLRLAIAGWNVIHVYRRKNTEAPWEIEAVLRPAPGPVDKVMRVVLDGDLCAATVETPERDRSVVVYQVGAKDAVWREVVRLTDPNSELNVRNFGQGLALSDNTLVVTTSDNQRPRLHVYERHHGGANRWGYVTSLASPFFVSGFGNSISLKGRTLVVGHSNAPGEKNIPDGVGAVFVYDGGQSIPGKWELVQTWRAKAQFPREFFGRVVDLEAGYLSIRSSCGNGQNKSGIINLLRRERENGGWKWSEVTELFPCPQPGTPHVKPSYDSGEYVVIPPDPESGEVLFFYDQSMVTIPIFDDERPLLILQNLEVTEPENGFTELVASITLSEPLDTSDLTVRLRTKAGTAEAGVDFQSIDQVVTIERGSTAARVPIVILADEVAEDDETFRLVLSDENHGRIETPEATVVIKNFEIEPFQPMIEIQAVEIEEGSSGVETPAVVALRLNQPADEDLIFSYRAAEDSSAELLQDFEWSSGLVHFRPGETEKKVAVRIFGDDLPEGDETFSVLFDPGKLSGVRWDGAWGLSHPVAEFGSDRDVGVSGRFVAIGIGSREEVNIYSPRSIDGESHWSLSQTLEPPDGKRYYRFGENLSLEGDKLLVAGTRAQDGALLFELDPASQSWHVIASLQIPDATRELSEVAVFEDTALVSIVQGSGEVHVFEANRGGVGKWGWNTKLELSGTRRSGVTGLALGADIAIVGDPRHMSDGTHSGRVHVFGRDSGGGGNWGKIQNVFLPDQNLVMRSVAYDPETNALAVRAVDQISVYERVNGQFQWRETVQEPFLGAGFRFAISGNHMVAGARTSGTDRVLVFERTEAGWALARALTSSHLDSRLLIDLDGTTFATPDSIWEKNHARITILGDELSPFLSLQDVEVEEGEAESVLVPVMLDSVSESPITIHYQTRNGSAQAGLDYEDRRGSVILPELTRATVIEIPIVNDSIQEEDETFLLTASTSVGLGLTQSTARITVTNDDWFAMVGAGDTARYLVPRENIGTDWTHPDFDDSAWQSGKLGAGYDLGSTYEPWILTDLEELMRGKQTTAYFRVPFDLDAVPSGDFILRVRFDDGYVAYLNGEPIHWRGIEGPGVASWNSSAILDRHHQFAIQQRSELLSSEAVELLKTGENVLAIHALNREASDSEFLIEPELVALDPASDLESWLAGIGDTSLRRAEDDGDADGVSNLLEYAGRTAPNNPRDRPSFITANDPAQLGRFSVHLPVDRPDDIVYFIQFQVGALSPNGWTNAAFLRTGEAEWDRLIEGITLLGAPEEGITKWRLSAEELSFVRLLIMRP